MEFNKNLVVSNQLVKGRYKLTKEEQKFIYLMISQINKDDTKFTEYEIHIKDLESAELTQKNYPRYREFARKLRSREIIIEDEKQILVSGWFSDICYVKNTGFIRATISEKLKPYLLQLKEEFVQAKLPVLLSFQSKYTSRLYLLLKSKYDRQKNYKNNLFKVYGLDELRNMFELPRSYITYYRNFKEKFLSKSLEEINDKTDFNISFKELKTGRKITSIEFCIKEKEKSEEQLFKELVETKTKSDYVPLGFNSIALSIICDDELGLTNSDIQNIFDNYSVEDVENICLDLWKCWESPKIKSKQGYFRGRLSQLRT